MLMLFISLLGLAGTPPRSENVSELSDLVTGSQPCSRPEDFSASIEHSFSVSSESWLQVEDVTIIYTGFHQSNCDIFLEDIVVQLDGRTLHTETYDQTTFGMGSPISHTLRLTNEASSASDIEVERLKLDAGQHTLTVTANAQLDGQTTTISLAANGLMRVGRDWDLDDYDDIALSDGDDCNDADPTIYPDAPELWYDGIDQDCAGDDDFDQDADGFQAEGEIAGGDDCDDTRADTYPGAEEVWYDGVDQDCAGDSDFDKDGDGYDSPDHGGDDCDDADGSSFPGSRTRDDDCGFVVRDDGSRPAPGEGPASGVGCTRGLPATGALLLLPIAALLRRRKSAHRS